MTSFTAMTLIPTGSPNTIREDGLIETHFLLDKTIAGKIKKTR
jgi:hypothetical protein